MLSKIKKQVAVLQVVEWSPSISRVTSSQPEVSLDNTLNHQNVHKIRQPPKLHKPVHSGCWFHGRCKIGEHCLYGIKPVPTDVQNFTCCGDFTMKLECPEQATLSHIWVKLLSKYSKIIIYKRVNNSDANWKSLELMLNLSLNVWEDSQLSRSSLSQRCCSVANASPFHLKGFINSALSS